MSVALDMTKVTPRIRAIELIMAMSFTEVTLDQGGANSTHVLPLSTYLQAGLNEGFFGAQVPARGRSLKAGRWAGVSGTRRTGHSRDPMLSPGAVATDTGGVGGISWPGIGWGRGTIVVRYRLTKV